MLEHRRQPQTPTPRAKIKYSMRSSSTLCPIWQRLRGAVRIGWNDIPDRRANCVDTDQGRKAVWAHHRMQTLPFGVRQREPSFALRRTHAHTARLPGAPPSHAAGSIAMRSPNLCNSSETAFRCSLPTVGALPYRETTVIQFRNHRTDGLILIDRTAPRSFTRLLALAAAALLISATHAAEPEPTPLVDQQHCMFCHTDNAAFLAPSFQQIADRYRNVPNAAAMLEHKLRWVDPPTGAIWPCRHPANGVAPYPRKTPTRWCNGS